MPVSLTIGQVDPLARVLEPPPDETPEQRQKRWRDEKDAKRINDDIDAELKLHRKAYSKDRLNTVRVLLLGKPRA